MTIHRNLALHMEDSYFDNEGGLKRLIWSFRLASLLSAEVIAWIIDIAARGLPCLWLKARMLPAPSRSGQVRCGLRRGPDRAAKRSSHRPTPELTRQPVGGRPADV